MHAFITGASGFLGKHLLEQLCQQHWKITALYRDPSHIPMQSSLITWVQGSIENLDRLRQVVPDELDCIFHLGANTSTWGLMHSQQYQSNVLGTKNMAKVALEKQAIRFVHTSSASVYGFHEDVIDEYSEMRGIDNPVSYVRSKFLAEEAIREAVKQGLDAVILNPTSMIGPYDERNWGPIFDGVANDKLPPVTESRHSFSYVQDVAKAHIQAFVYGRAGENYILSGPDSPLEDMYHWVTERLHKSMPCHNLPSWAMKTLGYMGSAMSLINRKEPALSCDKAHLLCADSVYSSEKAMRELQYRNTKSLEQMLESSFDWWQYQRLANHKPDFNKPFNLHGKHSEKEAA